MPEEGKRLSIKKRVPRAVCLLLAAVGVFLSAESVRAYDLVVAQDGSGDYLTVSAAILAAPRRQLGRTTIFIKAGVYHERITVPKSRPRLTLLGENRDTTIITSDGYTTVQGVDSYAVLTCNIQAKEFAARNLSFANTAGNVGQGTFAMWIEGNHAHFKNCALLGYQDTLYTAGNEAFFRHCFIEGAVDFIYGTSTAVFQGCTIHCIDSGYITAADTYEGQTYGFVFEGCTIYGEAPAGTVYLGRAYSPYASVAYLNCVMDAVIAPAGWDDFGDMTREATVDFAEYGSSGPGADIADRVDWSRQLTADADADYTLDQVFKLSPAPAFGTMLVAAAPWYADF